LLIQCALFSMSQNYKFKFCIDFTKSQNVVLNFKILEALFLSQILPILELAGNLGGGGGGAAEKASVSTAVHRISRGRICFVIDF